jgi:pimeloyl-ACP methyl ester carboxylesterase
MSAANSLHVEKLGRKGHPLLILHGWGHCLESLRPLGNLLAQHSQVHLIDLPGFGRSSPPDGVWDSSNYADRLIEYLNSEGLEAVDIVGHSFGGKVAMNLASRHPDRVRRLILMGASGLLRQRPLKEQFRFQGLKWAGKALKRIDAICGSELFKSRFAPRFGSSDYRQAGAMRSILVKTVNEDLTELIKGIRCPTLLLWGEEDPETPIEIAHRLNRLIKGSWLLIFPGKDHQVYKDAGAHLCAYYIFPFLAVEPQVAHV